MFTQLLVGAAAALQAAQPRLQPPALIGRITLDQGRQSLRPTNSQELME